MILPFILLKCDLVFIFFFLVVLVGQADSGNHLALLSFALKTVCVCIGKELLGTS